MDSRKTAARILHVLIESRPENIPTLDELPEAYVGDLVRAYHQSTIDENNERA